MMKTILRRAMLAVFALLTCTAVTMGTIGNTGHRSYIAALVLATVLVIVRNRFRPREFLTVKLGRIEPAKVCVMLSVLFLVFHAAWILFFRLEPENDYLTFWRTAVDLARGADLRLKQYVALYPHILGYSYVISRAIRLFGESVMTAAWLNVAFSLLTGILLYAIFIRKNMRKTAATTFLLWILIPSKLLYNTMVLSEPYYTFLLTLAFFLMEVMAEKEQEDWWRAILTGAAVGAILRLVNTARPIGTIPIIAFFIWLFFLCGKGLLRNRTKEWMLFSAALLVCYGVLGSVWHQFAIKQLEQEPASIPGYNIYVGFNTDSKGAYSEEDNMLLGETYDRLQNADAAQKIMLECAKERIKDNKAEIPGLMLRKLALFMGNDEGGAYYSKNGLSGTAYAVLCMISNIVYYYLCIRAIQGCVLLWRKDDDSTILLLPLFGIGLILAQLLVEVSGRYHYALIPVLVSLAAVAAAPFGEHEEILEIGTEAHEED